MARRLSSEERELWDRIRRTLRPLRPLPREPEKEVSAELAEGTGARAGESEHASPPAPRPAAPARPAEPSLASFEERERRRLARGLLELDARLDLHGMGQERAFHALSSFLRHSQARGARVVLVITGKGREGDTGRGVLRHAVPAWLSQPEFRSLVVGFTEAARRHGGAGALYVRIRRRAVRGSPA